MGGDLNFSYSDFLSVVDKHFDSIIYQEDDNEYEIKLHTHVDPLTLKSKKYQKLNVKKSDEKQIYHSEKGFIQSPHTPSAKELHHQISRIVNDDLKMHRAKKDYEFTQRAIDNQQQRQQGFEMDY